MHRLVPPSCVYLSDSPVPGAGRGVFAAVDIPEGSVIEVCPVIEIPPSDYEHLKATLLRNYYFMWHGEDRVALCLGFGSLYNHSYEPNATYEKDLSSRVITFKALRLVRKDEEITVNYNYGDPEDKSTLWIEDVPPAKEAA